MFNRLISFFKKPCEHLWIEWEHSDRPRQSFLNGTSLLKNPECAKCGEKKLKTAREKKDYIKKLKLEFKI